MDITKEWLKPHQPCTDGYRWFIEKFPQGAQFAEVYAGLRADRRYADSDWLVEKAFIGMPTVEMVGMTVAMTGADKAKIEAQVAADGASPDATATTGYRANAATTGNYANAATTGYRANAATTGEKTVSACLGFNGTASAGTDGAIVLAYFDDVAKRPRIKVGYTGESGLIAGQAYRLDENNEFTPV